MDDHSRKLENTRPLGKSDEDLREEQGNRTNPDTPREDVADEGIPPIPVLGATEGTPMAARGNQTPLLGKQTGSETADDNNDEFTDSDQA